MPPINLTAARNSVGAFTGTLGAQWRARDSIEFTKKDILTIIAQTNCESIRVYFAQNPNDPNRPTVVLVGIDGNHNNIVNTADAVFMEYGIASNVAL